MAEGDSTVTDLDALTAPAAADLLYITDASASGSSRNKKIQVSDLVSDIDSTSAETTAGVTIVDSTKPPGHLLRYGTGLGDGSNDDTSAFVAMLSFSGRKYVPKPSSKYKIDSHAFAASDISIFIEPGTIIETNSGYGASESMFHFAGYSGIVFDAYGVTFQFDSKPSSGEQRHIFRIQDTSDIWIYGATAKDSGGDGFYVGLRDAQAERVYIIDCVSDNNRRNGVSVTSGRDIFFINHLSKNTTGTSPQAGYDVEPNEDDGTPGQTEGPLENINFINCRSLDNVSNGFQYAGGADLTQIGPFSISFTNCVSRGDAVNFQVGGGDPAGTQEGIVEFSGCHGFDSDGNGLAIKGSNMPVVWTGGMIMNCNQAANGDNRNGSAVSIFSSNGTDGQDIGNVSVRGMKVRDPDGNMLKTVSMQLVNEATSTYSDIDLEIDAKGITTGKLSFMGTTGPTEPISIKYTHKPTAAVTAGVGSGNSPPYVHQKITNEGAVAGVNFNINSTASQIVGAWYEFESKVDGQNFTLTSDAGNEFMPDNVLTLRSTNSGEKIRVEWDGSNWQVVNQVGNWSITWDLDDTGTPTVAGGHLFITGGTTAITDFDDGSIGDIISILAAHSITITHGSPINLNGSGNFVMTSGDTLTLVMFNDQVWEEVARSTTTAASEAVTTTNAITAIESGKTFYLNNADGFTSTLPAPAIGLKYKFIVQTAPTEDDYVITTNGGDNILQGTFLDIVGELAPITNQDTLNFVEDVSIAGDNLEVESDGTNWYCTAFALADGGITVAVT